MSDTIPIPLETADPDASSPDADELAEHHEHAIMNRRLDEDLV